MLRNFLSRNTERLILFLSGVLISGVISGLIGNIITWSVSLLVMLVIVVTMTAVFLFTETSRRMQDLADKMETTVSYIEEPYREEQGVPYQGRLFKEIARLISEAENEILLLGTPYAEASQVHPTSLHISREQYLQAIEENVKRHRSGTFTYIRIQQIPWKMNDPSFLSTLGKVTNEHMQRILKIDQDENSPDLILNIMRIKTQRMNSFLIIDRRLIILEVDGYDATGFSYMIGCFFLEDRSGKLIKRFVQYFRNVERQAEDLSLVHFSESDISIEATKEAINSV